MHQTRASARGGAANRGTKVRKLHTKSSKKRTLAKTKPLTPTAASSTTSSQQSNSPQQQQSRAMSMNVYDDTAKEEVNTYSVVEKAPVLAQTFHSQSFLHLNRPKQLNALNLRMVRGITGYLRKWETNPQSLGIIMSGVGDKAFCAGGDILSLYDAGKRWNERGDESGYRYMASFFKEEYQLNWNISRMVTPLVAFMNGITMGGGVGLAMHAQHKVATEKTLFAMPETGIGFYPDVGASHFLSKLPHNIGMYLGLTGARLKAADLVHLGLANSFMFSDSYGQMFNQLTDDHHHHSNTDRVIHENAYDTDQLPRLSLTPHIDCIRRCFGKPTVEQIIEALEEEQVDKEFAQKTIATLKKMAPLSLKVTHEQLTRGRMMDLDECLTMEYDISRNMIENPDFYTGVKSVLIDKTTRGQRPNWVHSSINAVQDNDVYKYFETPHGLAKLVVNDKEPAKGSGWESIRRITFDEENARTAGPSAYQYPFFKPLPQQLNPVEWTSTAEFGASRDAFHLMYWNYLFKHTSTRFPLTKDPEPVQSKILSAHALQINEAEWEKMADQIQSFEQLLAPSPIDGPAGTIADEFDAMPTTLYKQRAAVMAAKKFVGVTQHPGEKKQFEDLIERFTPSNPDDKAMFGILNDKMEDLTLKYPMAAFVMNKMREVGAPLPLLLKNAGLKNPNEGKETFFVEEIMFKYPTEHIVAIKKQMKHYYQDVCKLLNVPIESAPAMMVAEFGEKTMDILGVFGEDWKSGLDIKDPKTGVPYGDLFSTFLESIESMSWDDAQKHAIQLGINTDPKALFPNDPTRQKIYGMMMDTVEHKQRKYEEERDAFEPEKLAQRMKRLKEGKNATDFDPNATIEERQPYEFLPDEPKYTSPYEDDVNVKGVFSEGEIDMPENARFVKQSRRSKMEKIFHAEIAKLQDMGAKLTPVQGGVLVEDLPNSAEVLKKFRLGKNFVKVRVALDNSELPEAIRPLDGVSYIVSIDDDGDLGDELGDAAAKLKSLVKNKHVIQDPDASPIEQELETSTNPFAPVASGGHYHGPTDLLRRLTLTRQKLHLSEEQVKNLQTKHAIFIPSTAANLESNAAILQRLIESRTPLPFDRGVNEAKMFRFAKTLQDHFDPSISNDPELMTDLHKANRASAAIAEAIQALNSSVHTDPVRIIDTGEILPGEVIPASIQRHMKPYEARIHDIPSPEMFHTSASLTAMTSAFHHVLRPEDKGKAIAKIKSFSHLEEGQPEFKGKAVEYTTAKEMFVQELASASHDITRPPEAQGDPNWTPLISSPHPVFHDFVSDASPDSPFMPVSREERLARNFLNFIRVPHYAVDAVYPAFNYFLDDPARHPGKNLQLNFEGANPYGEHPDAFKINFGDISRPMLPPKLAATLNAHFATIKAHEDHKGNQKV